MPKETFLRLPPAKREAFVDAALDEFAGLPFDQASISAVVRRLGIAKGSVYQYFDDKVDLFGWLLDEAVRRRQARFAALPLPEGGTTWDRLALAYRAGLGWWREAPRWNRLLLRLLEPSVEPRLVALRREKEAEVHRFLVGLLTAAQAAGDVREDVDLETAAWLAQGVLQEGLLRAFLGRLGTDLDGLAEVPPDDPRMDEALGVADEAVGWLRRALAP